jgi:hypothetical protein
MIKPVEKSSKWLEAARRAEKHIDDLQTAVRVFKKNAKNGEPWPGDEKAGTVVESAPAKV